MPDPHRSAAARVRAALKAAGVEFSSSYSSRIRGWRNWSRGVTVEVGHRDMLARVIAHGDIREYREKDLARAVAALRTAGFTLSDDGRVTAVPDARR
jgi:hypothetical protein